MSVDAVKLLRQHFGFEAFRPGQKEAIEALLEHGSALAVFPTGAGKSLCYQLPALALEGVTVVVSPLIALMKDQIDFLQGRGIAAARLDSTLSAQESAGISEQMREGTLKLLYVAPERFNNERFGELLKRTKISLFAVDEAHCISEWGHNFRPDYLKLAEMARELKAERVLALTATATPAVVRDICKHFRVPGQCTIITGFYRHNLELYISPATARQRDDLLIQRIKDRPPGSSIVYVTLQKTAERIASKLADAGLPARAYHAGMDNEVRTEVQEWWMKSDRGIVVATIAFGMGIDKPDVRYVYHYNLPKSLESYSQEIGRAGRDDQPSVVELLACPDDVPTLENFAYGDTPTDTAVRGLLREVLGEREDSFNLDLYELSGRHDIRLLVLRTALTYLELLGILRQGTPFYAGYELRPLISQREIAGKFEGERARFIEDLFARAKAGRTWYKFNPDEIAADLKQDRMRIVRALDYLAEQGWAELRAADVRSTFTRLKPVADLDALSEILVKRFAKREENEIRRVGLVLRWAMHDGCLTNALAAYFGQKRCEPCGHCVHCQTRRPLELPTAEPLPPLDEEIDGRSVNRLRREHAEALGHPRQAARFLCGLTSPALTRAKLSRHELFGRLEHRGVGEVLGWCEGRS